MALVEAKCPNCGGGLRIDNEKKAAVCPFCKEAYIVQEAINNYNYVTNNYTSIENLHAGTVNISTEQDFIIRGGELVRYNGASTNVIIPNTVTKIGGQEVNRNFEGAFENCTQIKSVIIPDSVKIIGNRSFVNCSGLTNLSIPSSVVEIENGSISIYNDWRGAFYGCISLTNVHISNGLKSIGNGAFAECTSLESIQMPDSLITLGNDAFSGCKSLTSIRVPNSVITIGDGAFSRCTSLMSVQIPNSVKSIGSGAFYFCKGLTSLQIPAGVSTIKSGTFNQCSNLISISIPDSVTSIGEMVFKDCSKMDMVIIPHSVTKIDDFAFRDCIGLKTVVMYGEPIISPSSFAGCRSIVDIQASNEWKRKNRDYFEYLEAYQPKRRGWFL